MFCRVDREQLSRSRIATSTNEPGGEDQQGGSGVSSEFLEALPPNIREEVLEQERRERVRLFFNKSESSIGFCFSC